jgi:hypothetical protein
MLVKKLESLLTLPARCLPRHAGAGALLFLVLVLVGLPVLCACASTAAGLQREHYAYETTSNVVAVLTQVAPFVPAPGFPIAQIVTALAGALLAFWSSHLHGRIVKLQDGQSGGPAPPRPVAGPPGGHPPAA